MMNARLFVLLAMFAVSTTAALADEGAKEEKERPLTAAEAAAGKALYLQECSGCHGERGDGGGPAAEYIDPRPRNFLAGKFKLRTTKSGAAPATSDVLRTIERGIPGTAMPSFAFLPADDRKKIAAYVLKLADVLDEPEPEVAVEHGGAPPSATAESIGKGKQLYVDAGCPSCHGDVGRGDGPAAADLRDTDGRPIKARDFTAGVYRGGGERAEVYARLVTGMDGTPMPAYGDVIEGKDMWALVDYVLSLHQPAAPKPRPAEVMAAGREVAAQYGCGGCHVLDDGHGGDVGPDLRVSGQKLQSEWVRTFLKNPRAYGKIYPWRVYRMPQLSLKDDEIEVLSNYLAAMGQRSKTAAALPDPATFPDDRVAQGKLVFMLRCTECHNLGKVIEIPVVKQQGPDLIRVPNRLDYEWAKRWILNPKQIDPKTRMVAPDITPEQAEAVRMFVWKTAMENTKAASGPESQPVARAR